MLPLCNSESEVDRCQTHGHKFTNALDGRKQPIRGLWVRNGRYYAQLKVEDRITGTKKTRRIPLREAAGSPVETLAQSREELARLQTQCADNALPELEQTPRLADLAKRYLEITSLGKPGEESKQASTIEKERAILGRWAEHVGGLRLDQIRRVDVNRFMDARRKEFDKDDNPKVSARTINLDVVRLWVCLNSTPSSWSRLSDSQARRGPDLPGAPSKHFVAAHFGKTAMPLNEKPAEDSRRVCSHAWGEKQTQAPRE